MAKTKAETGIKTSITNNRSNARTKGSKMIVYVVGDHGPEHNSIRSVHRTYEGAFKEWNKLRIELLREAQSLLKKEDTCIDIWKRMVKNLQCKDPKKIDNFPQETPYIKEWAVEE